MKHFLCGWLPSGEDNHGYVQLVLGTKGRWLRSQHHLRVFPGELGRHWDVYISLPPSTLHSALIIYGWRCMEPSWACWQGKGDGWGSTLCSFSECLP